MRAPLSRSIERHVLAWRERAWPVPWDEVFRRAAPLELEIGFGNGEFLAELAAARPERDHVGIELSWSAATRLLRRLEKADVANVRCLLVDAEAALRHLFASGSLDAVTANHPCPWPKARHAARRLFGPAALALVADRLRPGAPFTLVTDHDEYADWFEEQLASQSALESRHPTARVDAIPGRRPTKYERKALARGERIHYFQWRKAARPETVAGPPPSDPSVMPSLSLRGAHDPDALFRGFEPRTHQESHEGVTVVCRLGAVYRRIESASWLVEALVKEDRLRQEFAILVVERSPEELLVKLAGLGSPHPTYGVKRAVHHVGAWLRERHPELEIAHQNLGAEAMG